MRHALRLWALYIQVCFNPFQTNRIFHKDTYNKVRMVLFIYWAVMSYNFQKLLDSFLWRTILFQQTVQSLMKCRIMRHFIWVFAVCQSTRLGVSSLKRVKDTKYCMWSNNHTCSYNHTLSTLWVTNTIIEPQHEISNNVVCATSKGSDHPCAYARSDKSLCWRLIILGLLSYWPNIIWSF